MNSSLPRPGVHYVYVLFRPDGRPFYVGKGQGHRMFDHDAEARSGFPSHKCNVIRKIWSQGGTIRREIVFETSIAADALAREIELIAHYGRPPLTNKTAGGEGLLDPSPEVRAKIGAASRARGGFSPQAKARSLEVCTGRKNTPESIELMRQVSLNRSPEWRANHRAARIACEVRRMETDTVTQRIDALLRDGVSPEQVAEDTGRSLWTIYHRRSRLHSDLVALRGQRKLTDAGVVLILEELRAGLSHTAIAAQHKVSRRTIGFIHQGITWTHIPRLPVVSGAHTSVGDCRSTLALLKKMAASE